MVLHGVDVYDPNTGELRTNNTDQIAPWMIDTACNGESFFVRHCYFTDGQDRYERLKAALKDEIDPDAWVSLHRTESRTFPRPATGRIAVKVRSTASSTSSPDRWPRSGYAGWTDSRPSSMPAATTPGASSTGFHPTGSCTS